MASNSGFYGSGTGVCIDGHWLKISTCTLTNSFDCEQKDTTFRRTWNKEEYAAKAKDREAADKLAEENEDRKAKGLKPKFHRSSTSAQPQRELLKARDEKIVLDANLNKTQVVSVGAAGPASKQPGFYCKACDCVVKDSTNYLDHINGKKRKEKKHSTASKLPYGY
jgi:U4/U6.U5 tri-snRNP component SNU23